MYVGSFGYSVLMIFNVLCIAIIYARNMFWCPCSLFRDVKAFRAIYTIPISFSSPFSRVDFFGLHKRTICIVVELRVEF